MHGGNYIKEGRDSAKSTCLIFSPKEEDSVGALARYLKLFTVSVSCTRTIAINRWDFSLQLQNFKTEQLIFHFIYKMNEIK